MSQTLSAEPLAQVTRSVLADAAFLFCDDVPDDAAPLEGRLAEATVTFTAPRSGRLTLRLPWAVACEAAANLLGADKDDPEADEGALSAVGELLNMISGSALAAWFGAATAWSLGVPVTSEREGRLPSAGPRGGVVSFVIDDARMEIEAIETGGAGDDQGSRR